MKHNIGHRVGNTLNLTQLSSWAQVGRVESLLIPELHRAMVKAGSDPAEILVQTWYRHDSHADIGGLVFTTEAAPERLTKWLRAWCDKQYKNSSRCTDWNSYYCLLVEGMHDNEVWLRTSSYNIGD